MVALGVVYLLAVLLVSSVWGTVLGLATALISAAAFNFFHLPPTGRFTIAEGENWVALIVFFVTAIVASQLAEQGRRRAEEAQQRSREADLAAEMARLLLGGASIDESLRVVGQRIARVRPPLGGHRARLGQRPRSAAAHCRCWWKAAAPAPCWSPGTRRDRRSRPCRIAWYRRSRHWWAPPAGAKSWRQHSARVGAGLKLCVLRRPAASLVDRIPGFIDRDLALDGFKHVNARGRGEVQALDHNIRKLGRDRVALCRCLCGRLPEV